MGTGPCVFGLWSLRNTVQKVKQNSFDEVYVASYLRNWYMYLVLAFGDMLWSVRV